MSSKLIYEVKDRIAYITINRPEVMNAMDPEVYAAISKAWVDVRDNPDVWVAIVTGAGEKAFTAGADLKSRSKRPPAERADFWLTQRDMLLNRGLEVWKPVIAAVNGTASSTASTIVPARTPLAPSCTAWTVSVRPMPAVSTIVRVAGGSGRHDSAAVVRRPRTVSAARAARMPAAHP